MYSAENSRYVQAGPRGPRRVYHWARINTVDPGQVHQRRKLVTTTKSVAQPNTTPLGRPIGTINTRKPGHAETHMHGDKVRIVPALIHAVAPKLGYCLHTPSHLFEIERMTRTPANKPILGKVVRTNAVHVDNSAPSWRFTRRHNLQFHTRQQSATSRRKTSVTWSRGPD